MSLSLCIVLVQPRTCPNMTDWDIKHQTKLTVDQTGWNPTRQLSPHTLGLKMIHKSRFSLDVVKKISINLFNMILCEHVKISVVFIVCI